MRGKRWLAAILCLLLLAGLGASALGEEYTTLEPGMKGTDVKRLKVAMYWLGYFKTADVSDSYNDVMVERVKQLQRNNGLEETGIADPALQELVFSGNAVKTATAPKPSPVPPTPIPVVSPQTTPQPPALTEAGFLSPDSGMEEYVYENEADGLWVYISRDLAVDLRRYTDVENATVWFEADIHCSPEAPLTSFLTQPYPAGKEVKSVKMRYPQELARENKVVLAFTDDQFGDRINGGSKPGVIVRNGQIIVDNTVEKDKFPNLQVLAVFRDGSMKAFGSTAHTAQEYVDMGAMTTYAFGPILVTDGHLGDYMLRDEYYTYREPRCAIGMIEPYHYMLIVVKGRFNYSNGQYFAGQYMTWVADKMLEKGVVEALNLDGGGTTALMFMGKLIRISDNETRHVSGISGFGYSEQVR